MDMKKEIFFTGYCSFIGEKIYLGDKLKHFVVGNLGSSFVVQYDTETTDFVLVPFGRNSHEAPFRKYPLKGNLDSEFSKYHVVGNVMFCEIPKVGAFVKVTVSNKGEFFPFGSFVEVIEVYEWKILVKSDDKQYIELNFNEFILKRA